MYLLFIGISCFSGTSSVTTTEGVMPMNKLREGVQVLTANGFEPVLGMIHASNQNVRDMIEITLSSGDQFRASKNHYVFQQDGSSIPVQI